LHVSPITSKITPNLAQTNKIQLRNNNLRTCFPAFLSGLFSRETSFRPRIGFRSRRALDREFRHLNFKFCCLLLHFAVRDCTHDASCDPLSLVKASVYKHTSRDSLFDRGRGSQQSSPIPITKVKSHAGRLRTVRARARALALADI